MAPESPGSTDNMSNGQCGQRGTAERYLLGELSDTERQAFEAHYFECPWCGEDVKTTSAFLEGARQALGRPQRARAPRPARRWAGATVGLAAAAAIGLVAAGYQGLVAIPSLRQELSVRDRPRAIVATVVRDQSRGAATVVTAAPDQPFIVLALETPGQPPLSAELRREEGALVLPPWPIEAARPGEPLQLLIPAKNLAAGKYRLVIRAGEPQQAAGKNPELGSYSFELERARS